jgi:hypothetical protein
MKDQLTGTDIRYIARGHWRRGFKWGFHHKVKTPMVISLVTFIAGLAVLIGDAIDNYGAPSVARNSTTEIITAGTHSAVGFVAIALVLVAAGFFIRAMYISESEEDKFLDSITAAWESGDHSIPNTDTVAKFLSESK